MPKNITRIVAILLATFTGLVLVACNDINKKNELSIYICDSPADYSAINFNITNVDIHPAEGDAWTPLTIANNHVSLLELTNGKMQEMGVMKMPLGGRYDAVRFTFDTKNAHVTAHGERYVLAFAPENAVVEVGFDAITMDGKNTPLLFDIDAASSVVDDPTVDTGYRFHPQITFLDNNQYGVVKGGLQAGEDAVSSRIWMHFTNDDTGKVSSTYSSVSSFGGNIGAFFIRLTPGEYTLVVEPSPADNLKPYTTKVSVKRHDETDLKTIILEPIIVEQS